MKTKKIVTIQYVSMLMLLVFSSTILCAQDIGTHPLIGTWEFDYGPSLSKMETSTKTRLDGLPQQKSSVEAAYRGRKVIFDSDGSYVQLLADGRSATGIWSLGDNNMVLITDPRGNSYPQRITMLTDSHLVLEPIVEGQTKSLFPEWHFNKLKN